MAHEFDTEAARIKHYRLMDKLVQAKNRIALTTDYYYDYPPQDEARQQEELRDIYNAAKEARDELDGVVNELY